MTEPKIVYESDPYRVTLRENGEMIIENTVAQNCYVITPKSLTPVFTYFLDKRTPDSVKRAACQAILMEKNK